MDLLHVAELLALTAVNAQVFPCCFDVAMRACEHRVHSCVHAIAVTSAIIGGLLGVGWASVVYKLHRAHYR